MPGSTGPPPSPRVMLTSCAFTARPMARDMTKIWLGSACCTTCAFVSTRSPAMKKPLPWPIPDGPAEAIITVACSSNCASEPLKGRGASPWRCGMAGGTASGRTGWRSGGGFRPSGPSGVQTLGVAARRRMRSRSRSNASLVSRCRRMALRVAASSTIETVCCCPAKSRCICVQASQKPNARKVSATSDSSGKSQAAPPKGARGAGAMAGGGGGGGGGGMREAAAGGGAAGATGAGAAMAAFVRKPSGAEARRCE